MIDIIFFLLILQSFKYVYFNYFIFTCSVDISRYGKTVKQLEDSDKLALQM